MDKDQVKTSAAGICQQAGQKLSMSADSIRSRALAALLKAGLEDKTFTPSSAQIQHWRECHMPAEAKNTSGNTFELVLVAAEEDLPIIAKYFHFYEKNVSPSSIVVITKNSPKAKTLLKNIPVRILDENTILPGLTFENIHAINSKKTGWYFQQFLKMAYANICQHDFYIIFDGDTIPLRPLSFFRDNKMVFIKKGEYFEPYFNMIDTLFNGCVKRSVQFSFISECMIIKKSIMCNIIKDIEHNNNIHGSTFFEKILHCVYVDKLQGRDFSEYETYGNYIARYHANEYDVQQLCTLREAMKFFDDLPEDYILDYLSRDFDTISFERKHTNNKTLTLTAYINKCICEFAHQ